MNSTAISANSRKAWIRGLLDGLAAPFTAFAPSRISTQVEKSLVQYSYVGPSEDAANIRRDFEKVLKRVQQEASAQEAR